MIELKYKIGIVEYDFNEIIEEWFDENYISEAKEILYNMLKWNNSKSQHLIIEWIIYIERKMGNQICMHLDYMKYELIKHDVMSDNGKFGKPYKD